MTHAEEIDHLRSLARGAVRELRQAAYRLQDVDPSSADAERMLDVADALAEHLARMG